MFTSFKSLSESTHQPWFATSLVALRVVLGAQLLMAGLDKFGDWSSAGYLKGATGPFADFFQSIAGNPLVDPLNAWGLTLIGIALILGIFVRPASFFGILVMVLYYFSGFESNTSHGIIDFHIIYSLILLMFMAGGVGHVFGLDGIISGNLRKKKSRLVKFLFG